MALARAVTIAPTQTQGVSASNVITASHSHRPSITPTLESQRQHKAPVGLIVGVAIAIIGAIIGLFLIRWLFVRRARARRTSTSKSSLDAPAAFSDPNPMRTPARLPGGPGAVELGAYPLSSASNPRMAPSDSWHTSFPHPPLSGSGRQEPGPGSSPTERQAWLASELRSAQTALERTQGYGTGGNEQQERQRLRAEIRELENRQGNKDSPAAMGLSKLVLALSCFVLCIQASNPKRGIALVQSSDADLPKGSGGQCSWFYNWAASPPAGYPRSLEFVPMLWGHQDSGIFVQTVRQLGASTVLGFNEPNEYGQSNIGVPEAVQMWKAYIQPLKNSGVRLGSPAVSSGPSGLPWLVNFVASCSGCSIDFVVVHWYGEGATNFINYLASVHAQIPNKAVWVTEFACTSGNPAGRFVLGSIRSAI
ncbi:unnamed protein product [Mycena citricolor]|uniref:Asl1-like glycosyl hydrolase catalytic domain-containing protein n=1 Tax=Mycena citricolor TaxID=2018698 RepID=A0AAD2GV57_9AGAR|nr:unnamed protein product [Mycena citricolor]